MKRTHTFFAGIILPLIVFLAAIAWLLNVERTESIVEAHTPTPTMAVVKLHFPTESAVELKYETPTASPTAEPTEVPTDTCGQKWTLVDTPEPTETPEPTTAPTEAPTETPTAEPKHYFLATAYSSDPAENGEWGAVDCFYGKPLPENAIAADLSVLPYGTRVYIDGIGERVVVDTAGEETLNNMRGWAKSKKCEGWIDIYVGDDKDWMHDWGVRVVTLTILEWGSGR